MAKGSQESCSSIAKEKVLFGCRLDAIKLMPSNRCKSTLRFANHTNRIIQVLWYYAPVSKCCWTVKTFLEISSNLKKFRTLRCESERDRKIESSSDSAHTRLDHHHRSFCEDASLKIAFKGKELFMRTQCRHHRAWNSLDCDASCTVQSTGANLILLAVTQFHPTVLYTFLNRRYLLHMCLFYLLSFSFELKVHLGCALKHFEWGLG